TAGCLRLASSEDEGNAANSPTASPTGPGEAGETPTAPSTRTEDAADGPTPTEEPETPTEAGSEPTATPEYPLGLTRDGVEPFLFDQHKNELSTTGFHTVFTAINRADGSIKEHKEFEVETGFALGHWTFDQGGPVTMFRSSDGGFWREDLGDHFTYGEDRDNYSIHTVVWGAWTEPVVTGGEWGPPELVSGGAEAAWRVETTGFDPSTEVPGFFMGDLEALDATMTVNHQGIITRLDAAFEATLTHGGTTEYEIQYEVGSIGEVTVNEPDWVSTARERRPQVSTALTDDRQFVRLEHEAGNPIEPNTRWVLWDHDVANGEINYFLKEPITEGETVYFYEEE
ncbi:MAG: hypothetical protein R3324_21435, partial [Halobacteriales archaeon]|nr:hypothetical protein [Halobacteriales archaeon]